MSERSSTFLSEKEEPASSALFSENGDGPALHLHQEMMNDPTYILSEIDGNPEWALAFVLSEILNDDAPIGWSLYCGAARCLLDAGYRKVAGDGRYRLRLAG